MERMSIAELLTGKRKIGGARKGHRRGDEGDGSCTIKILYI
jgi:hypothetical protein